MALGEQWGEAELEYVKRRGLQDGDGRQRERENIMDRKIHVSVGAWFFSTS